MPVFVTSSFSKPLFAAKMDSRPSARPFSDRSRDFSQEFPASPSEMSRASLSELGQTAEFRLWFHLPRCHVGTFFVQPDMCGELGQFGPSPPRSIRTWKASTHSSWRSAAKPPDAKGKYTCPSNGQGGKSVFKKIGEPISGPISIFPNFEPQAHVLLQPGRSFPRPRFAFSASAASPALRMGPAPVRVPCSSSTERKEKDGSAERKFCITARSRKRQESLASCELVRA